MDEKKGIKYLSDITPDCAAEFEQKYQDGSILLRKNWRPDRGSQY
jgi:hypothetical protein